MVEFFRNWVLNIVTVIIFIVFIETITPSEKFKQYIKLATGLVLMIVIINPIVTLVSKANSLDKLTVQSFNQFEKSDMQSKMKTVEEVQNDQIIGIYKSKLSEQVKEQILSIKDIGDADVKVEVEEDSKSKDFGLVISIEAVLYGQKKRSTNTSGGVQQVNISYDEKGVSEKIMAQARDKLAETYGLPAEKIKINTQKTGG